MSLYIALTGLKGAQSALTVTSNNIANANSVGFKRSNTRFADMVAASGLGGAARGVGTVLKSTNQQFDQGIIEKTGNTFDLALSGQGFLATRPDLLSTDVSYTRNGSFNLDENGYVTGSSGQHLLVYPVNAEGRVTSNGVDALRPLLLPATSGEPKATTDLELSVNLPAEADVVADAPGYAFNVNDPLTYNLRTSATFYDSEGNPQLGTVYYARAKGPDTTDDTSLWNMHIVMENGEATPAGGIQLAFDENGVMTGPAGPVTLPPYDPANGADPLNITFDPGTATEQTNEPFGVYALRQNGVPPGKLDAVSINEQGLVIAGFSNGETVAIGKVAVVNFANPQALTQVGQATYKVSGASGEAVFGEPGKNGLGTVLSGNVERANVDITEELVNLITAQRNFQANAKAIETDNAMTQSIINIRS